MRTFAQLRCLTAILALAGVASTCGADEKKPASRKPADSKPADSKPADSKPADSTPADRADDFEQSIRRKAADYPANILAIYDAAPPNTLSRDQQRKWPRLAPADAEAIAANCPAAAHVSPLLQYCAGVSYQGNSWEQLIGVNADYLAIAELKVAQGAALTEAEVRSGAKVCILAPESAERFFGRESAVGKTVSLNRADREDDPIPLRVIGVLAAKGPGLEERPLPMQNLVPWTLIDQTFRGRRRGIFLLAAKAAGREKVPEATSQITQLLRKRRGVAPGQPDGFGIHCNNVRIDEQVARALAFQRAFPHGAAEYEKAMKAEGVLSLFGDAEADSKVSLEGVHSVKAFLARGRARLQTGRFDGTVADFSEAVRLDPKSVDAWSARGMACYDRGDFDKAVADFSEVLRLAPKTFKARLARGAAYGKKGEHDRAIADFTAAIIADPNYALAYGYRAMDFYRQGDMEHALADFNEALRRDPKDAVSRRNRGKLYLVQGRLDQAIADCSESLWRNPIDPETYRCRSAAYTKRGDKAKAAADAAWAKKLSDAPARPKAIAEIQYLAIAEQGLPIIQAMHDYRNEHGLWPQRVVDFAQKYLGRQDIGLWRYEWTSGDKRLFCPIGFPVAIAQYQISGGSGQWEMNYGDDQLHLPATRPKLEASKLSEQQLIEATIAEFRMRIAREPGQDEHRSGLISFLTRHKRLAEAEKECAAMAARSPKDVWPMKTLARVLVEQGQSDRAVAQMKEFVARNPSCSNHVALVDFYRSLGRHSDALAAIRESLKMPEVTAPLQDDHAEWSLFSFAGYAYAQKQYDLVLAIAQAWDDIDLEVGSGDRSFHALRAAVYLAQGKFDEAKEHCRRAERYAQSAGHGPLAGDLDALKQAIEAKNAKFAYGGLKEPWGAETATEKYY